MLYIVNLIILIEESEMIHPKKLLLPLVICLSLGTQQTLAETLQPLRLQPVGTLEGFIGKGEVIQGQVLLPLVGDVNHLWFGNLEGKFGTSKNDSMLGIATGYRKIINNRMWGGYLSASYNSLQSGLHSWFVNPGIESLGMVWDFRVNGYFSISNPNRYTTGSSTDWANEAGDYDYVRFAGHTMYDRQISGTYETNEQMGRGLDAEVGRTVPLIKGLKFYLGGYHFDTKSNGSINGVASRLSYELNDYVSLEGKYNYDGYKHNVALFGIKFSINGMSRKEKDALGISARLFDNIEHNMGTISSGTTTPTKTQEKYHSTTSSEQVQNGNVWFVNPEASSGGDGTYEHPLNEVDEHVIDDIGKTVDPVILLAPGTYNLSASDVQLPDNIELDAEALDFIHPSNKVNIDVSGTMHVGIGDILRGLNFKAAANAPVNSMEVLFDGRGEPVEKQTGITYCTFDMPVRVINLAGVYKDKYKTKIGLNFVGVNINGGLTIQNSIVTILPYYETIGRRTYYFSNHSYISSLNNQGGNKTFVTMYEGTKIGKSTLGKEDIYKWDAIWKKAFITPETPTGNLTFNEKGEVVLVQ